MLNFRTGNILRPPKFCEPAGPDFKKSQLQSLSIEGTLIEFRAPRHQPMIKGEKATYPDPTYKFDDMIFKSYFDKEFNVADEWLSTVLFNHSWTFKGPWLTGPLAVLSTSLIILKKKQQNINISLFHPRAFEQTIGDFLTNKYSKIKFEDKHEFITPINWQPITHLSVPACRLRVISNEEISRYQSIEYLFFPISNSHIGYFVFHPNRRVFNAITKAQHDEKIGEENINNLINNIIDSLKITLSHEIKTQQTKALKGLTDTSLVKEFFPIDWNNREFEAIKT